MCRADFDRARTVRRVIHMGAGALEDEDYCCTFAGVANANVLGLLAGTAESGGDPVPKFSAKVIANIGLEEWGAYGGRLLPTNGLQTSQVTEPDHVFATTEADADFVAAANAPYGDNGAFSFFALDASSGTAGSLFSQYLLRPRLPWCAQPVIQEAYALIDNGPGAGTARFDLDESLVAAAPYVALHSYHRRTDPAKRWRCDPSRTQLYVWLDNYVDEFDVVHPPTVEDVKSYLARGFIPGPCGGANSGDVLDFLAAISNLPSVAVSPFVAGRVPTYPGPQLGVDNFAPFVPIIEGLRVGEPPVPPVFVRRATRPYGVSMYRCGSGQVMTRRVPGNDRARFEIGWGPHLTAQQRNVLTLWVNEVVRGRLNVFTVRPDGAGTSQTVDLRFLQVPGSAMVGGACGGNPGSVQAWEFVEAEEAR